MNCDVLNLEWSSAGRDVDIVEPVLSHMEMTEGIRVRRESILDAPALIADIRPRMLLISNQGGAVVNFRAVRLAAKLGIPVVTLMSEGMFPDDAETVRRMWWGNNTDEHFYEDLNLQWSSRSVDLIRRYVPGAASFRIEVSGATGFDRYRLFEWSSRDELLRRLKRPGFDHVVGFAGWTFCHVLGAYYERNRSVMDVVLGGSDAVERHARQLPALRALIRQVVDANPDVLFVFKEHPGLTDPGLSEFSEIEDRPNAVIVRGIEVNVADLASAADLWLAYESTTTLEAWMLQTPTALVNPLGGDFKRSLVAGGSPVYTSADEVQAAIDAVRAGGSIPGFDALAMRRDELEAEVIGYADGRNHVRAAEKVLAVLGAAPATLAAAPMDDDVRDEIARTRRTMMLERVGMLRLPRYRRLRGDRERMRAKFDPAQREEMRVRYTEALATFHAKEVRS